MSSQNNTLCLFTTPLQVIHLLLLASQELLVVATQELLVVATQVLDTLHHLALDIHLLLEDLGSQVRIYYITEKC